MASFSLQNMVGPGEVDEELEPETAEECSKYGKVTKVIIFEVSLEWCPVPYWLQGDRSPILFVFFVNLHYNNYVLCSLTPLLPLEHMFPLIFFGDLQISGDKKILWLLHIFFRGSLHYPKSDFFSLTFSCSQSTSPFLCENLGMFHEKIFPSFVPVNVSLSDCLLVCFRLCVVYILYVWICFSVLYFENICKLHWVYCTVEKCAT